MSHDNGAADFAASDWYRTSLAAALKRDPVDAANDAAQLADVLEARALAILQRARSRAPFLTTRRLK